MRKPHQGIDAGLAVQDFDVKTGGEAENIFTLQGLQKAVMTVLKIKPGGLYWNAIDCRSFCWTGRFNTGRTVETPAGERERMSMGCASNSCSYALNLIKRLPFNLCKSNAHYCWLSSLPLDSYWFSHAVYPSDIFYTSLNI